MSEVQPVVKTVNVMHAAQTLQIMRRIIPVSANAAGLKPWSNEIVVRPQKEAETAPDK